MNQGRRTALVLLGMVAFVPYSANAEGTGSKTAYTQQSKTNATPQQPQDLSDTPLFKYQVQPNFLGGVPPESCAEWATISTPKTAANVRCKDLGGKALCSSRQGNPSYDVGPIQGAVMLGQPFKLHLRIRNLGVGDYIIYGFGKIDWGDNSQQSVFPFGVDVELQHTYDSATVFQVHAMGGAQFKYQGNGSGSYEVCTDNSLSVTVSQ